MSLRESICENIVTTLQAAVTPLTIKYVTRHPFKFENLSSAQFPACLVQTGAENREDVTMGDSRRRSDLIVEIFGFTKGINIDSDRNLLIETIEEALDVDRTRGGFALDTQVIEVQTDEGSIDPYGGVVVRARVTYTFIRGNS